jgi:hypothetical protein
MNTQKGIARWNMMATVAVAGLVLVAAHGCCNNTFKNPPLFNKKGAGDYVVYMYKLDVKDAAPKSHDDWFKRKTVAVLDAGTRVAVLETIPDKDPRFSTSRIRAGDVEGWVDANYLVDAASYDATLNKEYVVYVSDLEVLDGIDDGSDPNDPFPKNPKKVTTLRAGDRVVSRAACKGRSRDKYPLYRRICAGKAEGWVLDRFLVAAPEYDAAARDNKLDTLGDKYLVAVEKLNLRAAPSTAADVVAVLPCRTELANLSSRLDDNEEGERGGDSERSGVWRQVRVGDKEGWVADEYIIPIWVYDFYRRGDDLARAGDAAGMVAALKEGKRREISFRFPSPPFEPPTNDEIDDNVLASPDQRRVFLNIQVGPARVEEYAYDDLLLPSGLYGAGLAFEAGRGLADCGHEYAGAWAPDSRHFACRGPDNGIACYQFSLLDAETGGEKPLGAIFALKGQDDIEFLNGYIIWFDNEEVEFKGEPLEAPILVAYNVGTGEKIRLLKYDAATIRETKESLYAVYFDVVLVPADSPPPALRSSRMYKKWNGAHATAAAGAPV